MTQKPPPVPPANRSDKGPGDATRAPVDEGSHGREARNPDKQGQQGNVGQNTHHQGYQQDR